MWQPLWMGAAVSKETRTSRANTSTAGYDPGRVCEYSARDVQANMCLGRSTGLRFHCLCRIDRTGQGQPDNRCCDRGHKVMCSGPVSPPNSQRTFGGYSVMDLWYFFNYSSMELSHYSLMELAELKTGIDSLKGLIAEIAQMQPGPNAPYLQPPVLQPV